MNKSKRNKRISEKLRKIKKVEKWFYETYYFSYSEEQRNSIIKSNSITPKKCSCYMCGNPRKFFNEKTKQEIDSELKLKEELKDLDS